MKTRDFTTNLLVDQSPKEVFNAVKQIFSPQILAVS